LLAVLGERRAGHLQYATPGNVVYTDNPAAGLNGAQKIARRCRRRYGEERSALHGERAVAPDPALEGAASAQTEYRAAAPAHHDVTPLAERSPASIPALNTGGAGAPSRRGLMLARPLVIRALARR
jgi:hypothetical protein